MRDDKLRVIGGRLKGQKLYVPTRWAGRPTADRVRENMFNVLVHATWSIAVHGFTQHHVVDGFAGTGALGFEALSRGAKHVTFMERNRSAQRAIRRTAQNLGVTHMVKILDWDMTQPCLASTACGIGFIDPPYCRSLVCPSLEALSRNGWLIDGAITVVELSVNEALVLPHGFVSLDDRVYGSTRLVFLRHQL
tara:strand:+ start:2585 stop:3163 length:579 start_codon:yes stop_codon:yes gene_type:complete